MEALGIDVGGSGIKAAVVDTRKGELLSDRLRVPTPVNPDRAALIAALREIIAAHSWGNRPVGIGFPGVIKNNTILTAVNLHPDLVGLQLGLELHPEAPDLVTLINDADAAGTAEMQFGAGRPYREAGTVLLFTVGTGVGTVLFRNGVLVPNIEFGHVEYQGHHAESHVSERARKEQDLSWKRWGKRFSGYLKYMEFLFQPDFIILGGGGVKKREKFEEFIEIATPWTFAHFGNRSGIIGAATAATSR